MKALRLTNQITQRDSECVEKYLSEIGKTNMLTSEQEANLAKRIKNDDLEALEELVNSNLRFVVSVAKQYQNQGLPLSDLINEGNLGLIRAAKKFDETKGFKFISYAVWWIRQAIMQAIIEQSRIIRVPINKVGTFTKINRAFQAFEQEYQREPSIDELAEHVGMSKEDVNDYFKNNTPTLSTDARFTEGSSLADTLSNIEDMTPEQSLIKKSAEAELFAMLEQLNEREIEIITSYFGLRGKEPMTLEEIGQKFGLTRERVRQIKERSMQKLKQHTNPNLLDAFLG
ncbi:MAG: RNA polymerase sigma factor RpoD/SigA [Chitinophagales bacterium]|nr:RNA polymerase sigma factor RpoD/SigA [Chitinophagales bacterium]